ncbi:hypothetical protein CLV31_108177 [Algoriphagus aquaeductus]|uniref:Uncharacterized protein n=1 Tax=Algoriphagus aquaeductus TaxID=475299 RepID=A0A326RQH0_9BACT|nr:hypothetical protein CLV31_108177 [Algoriphagus aquaeductus]
MPRIIIPLCEKHLLMGISCEIIQESLVLGERKGYQDGFFKPRPQEAFSLTLKIKSLNTFM